MRERAVPGKRIRLDEVRRAAFVAEAEVFHLHDADHRVIVISLQEVDVAWPDPRHLPELVDVERPAAAELYRIVRERIMPLDRRQDAGTGEPLRPRVLLAHDEIGLRACTGHDTVVKHDRVCDQPRIHVFVERQRLFHQGVRNLQRVVALRDAQLAEVLPLDAEGIHVMAGHQREAAVRTARTVRIGGVL